MDNNKLTLVTCWYILKSKFDVKTYLRWIDNMLSNVFNYNLVIFSDENSYKHIIKYLTNPNIRLIIKPIEDFYTYKYKDYWEKNHILNYELNSKIEWRLNMLWSEKIYFVYETIQNKYFDTQYYAWCDIGYFREDSVRNWPNKEKIKSLNPNLIYYNNVQLNVNKIKHLKQMILNKNEHNLPRIPIPPDQVSFGGGFFVLHKDKIDYWKTLFYDKLLLYFEHGYLVKDDQIIIVDCILSNLEYFKIIRENNKKCDNWFAFVRYLS